MTPTIEIAALTITCAALGIAAYILFEIWRDKQIKQTKYKELHHNGTSTQYWYNYKTHRPNDPYGEYLVTDGCQYWTATYEDAIGTFEPLDWSVTHFTPILPPTENTMTAVPKWSKTPKTKSA